MRHFCGQECSYSSPLHNCNGCKYYDEFLAKVRANGITESTDTQKVNWNLDEVEAMALSNWLYGSPTKESKLKRSDVIIGDYVLSNNNPVCIVGVMHDQFAQYRLSYGIGGMSISKPIAEYEPIPITESFIQKNFQPRYKDIYELTTLWGIRPFHDHWQVCLLTMDEFGGGSWEGAFEVHYVHEVQQFLRLLKVEKEVKL